jgi:hypothetical protein
MPTRQILKISSDGSTVTGLHTDMLVKLGRPEITRASEVEFDSDMEAWTVKILFGPQAGTMLPGFFARRADALAAEREFFNTQMLLEGGVHA